MKNMISFIFVSSCALLSVNAFGKMTIDQQNIGESWINGKISHFQYGCSYIENSCTTTRNIYIDIRSSDNKTYQIKFTERDLPIGITLGNAIGKSVTVSVLPETGEVSHISHN